MTPQSSFRRGLALLLLVGMLAGCSTLPTAPDVARNSTSSMQTGATADPVAVDGAEASRTIDPNFGGTVGAGQFRVIVPPGALRTTATVTVKQAEPARRVVELHVTPASANGFLVPVTLVVDCSDMTSQALSLQTIYWWNPTASRWEAVPGVHINLQNRSISAPLQHFSTYKVDSKAGW